MAIPAADFAADTPTTSRPVPLSKLTGITVSWPMLPLWVWWGKPLKVFQCVPGWGSCSPQSPTGPIQIRRESCQKGHCSSDVLLNLELLQAPISLAPQAHLPQQHLSSHPISAAFPLITTVSDLHPWFLCTVSFHPPPQSLLVAAPTPLSPKAHMSFASFATLAWT